MPAHPEDSSHPLPDAESGVLPDPAPTGSRRATRPSRRPGSGPFDLHSPMEWLRLIGRNSRRLAVFVVGVAILGAGAAMLVLPGPGVLVIVVGLAVLATEFAWAERALDRTTATAATAASKVAGSRSGRLALIASGLGMVVGGATVVALVGQYRLIGATVAVAGAIGLATLTPPVQRWLETRTADRAASAPDTPASTDPAPIGARPENGAST